MRKAFFCNFTFKTSILVHFYAKNKRFHKNENHYFYFIFLSQKRPLEKKCHFLNWFGAQSPLLNQKASFSINSEHELFPKHVFVPERWKYIVLTDN